MIPEPEIETVDEPVIEEVIEKEAAKPTKVCFIVVKKHWYSYMVYRSTEYTFRNGSYLIDQVEIRRFFRPKVAEKCAAGLAFGTWTNEGPITATYAASEEEVKNALDF